MKFVIQRVKEASVTIDNQVKGNIKEGLLVYIGVGHEDSQVIADKMVSKLLNLRIFSDSEGKTNLSLQDIHGQILLISQFTLYANCKKGNRPSFTQAGAPDMANALYEYIIDSVRMQVSDVQTGEFGADMVVQSINDGPFTIILDSDEIM